MFKAFKQFGHLLGEKKLFFGILYFLSIIFRQRDFKQRLIKIKVEKKFFSKISQPTAILRGPFKGMIYPKLKSSYSEMAPKILGSYEAELVEPINEIIHKQYNQIVDIGCAEGYYAVGLAAKIPKAHVYAFDINPKALKMCLEMAELNKVSDRIHLSQKCTDDTLKSFNFKNKSLIICDCEGCEMKLFTKDNIGSLINCDLIIELHDILGLPVKESLLPLFKDTHHIKLIRSETRNPDIYPELVGIDETEKRIILSECRDGLFGNKTMEWAYITSKNND